jgi:hypothetical protein
MKTTGDILVNKSLLRKIKQECFIGNPSVLEVDELEFEEFLNKEYKEANTKPYNEWTINELYTRQEEITQLTYKISVLFPIYYKEEYWMYGGEYYDIMDELDNRFYEARYSIYDDY